MGTSHQHIIPRIPFQKMGPRAQELRAVPRFTEQDFRAFCAENPDLLAEQDKNGNILVMAPVDFNGGIAESTAHGYLFVWWLQTQKGQVFSPSTGFNLPDGSTRSADGAWASDEKIAAVSAKDRKRFAPIVPDFVIEIRSESDRLAKLKKKMHLTWMANGVQLAWLIDPKNKKTYIYRQGCAPEELDGFDHILSGEGVCPGFEFHLKNL